MQDSGFRSVSRWAVAAALLATSAVVTTLARGSENWPAFRGGDALSVAEDDERLPLTWSETENVVWKTPI